MENRTKGQIVDKKTELIINKKNVVVDQDEINEQIKDDEDIDLEKIKKYFENVINEKHFVANYGKSRIRFEEGKTVDDTEIKEQ